VNAPVRDITRDDYAPTVRALMPGSDGEDMEIRCSLLLMRDCATSAKRYCSEEAWPVLDHVERLASHYAFKHMPLDRFTELRAAMRKLVAAAGALDEATKDQPARGGMDTRV
jgi:hypothetical protein